VIKDEFPYESTRICKNTEAKNYPLIFHLSVVQMWSGK